MTSLRDVRARLPATRPRRFIPSNGCRSANSPQRALSCPRVCSRPARLVRSPARERLFQSARRIETLSTRPLSHRSAVSMSNGAPSKVPRACIVARGAVNKSFACTSADTVPGGEPRTESVDVRTASAAGPSRRPASFSVPARAGDNADMSATLRSQRAFTLAAPPARSASDRPMAGDAAAATLLPLSDRLSARPVSKSFWMSKVLSVIAADS